MYASCSLAARIATQSDQCQLTTTSKQWTVEKQVQDPAAYPIHYDYVYQETGIATKSKLLWLTSTNV